MDEDSKSPPENNEPTDAASESAEEPRTSEKASPAIIADAAVPAGLEGARRVPTELPILPSRDTVTFPGTIMPLNIGRERSKAVIEKALRGNKLIGVLTQRNRDIDEPTIQQLYQVGTVCMILKSLTLPDGTLNVIVHGLSRLTVDAVVRNEPYMVARIRTHEDSVERSPAIDALVYNAKQAAYRIIELSPNIPDDARIVLDNIATPGGVADFLAANLAVGTASRQQLLEIFDVPERLRQLVAMLAQQIEVLELSAQIQSQVREQIDRNQREYFLHEQMKVIQRELGESDARISEVQRLRERIEKSGMPESARREAERELTRMTRIPQSSPEYSVAVDYVTWLSDLPWQEATTDNLNLNRAKRILNEDHYDLQKVKQRILEFLAIRKLKADGRGPILCFIGPPGVGKTSLGQSIARAMDRKFIRISLGGMHDESQLRGHRRTYIGALPGRIIQEIRKVGVKNPVFMLDEVDKLASDYHGDPASALLEILDPQQNNTFTDNYLDVPFDLSKVLFIATANYADGIPSPLRDRMEMIRLSGYTTSEKIFIAQRYLIPRQLRECGLASLPPCPPDKAGRRNGRSSKQARHTATPAAPQPNGSPTALVTFDEPILDYIISKYTREAGVRSLERQIAAIVRAVASRVARGRREPVKVTLPLVKKFLGPTRFESERIQRTAEPGVAVGLAYTPTGGDILFIEATAMPGKGHMILTGQLGDVMRESAQAAYSIIRAHADAFELDKKMLNDSDIHLHVPAGAIPKDGPSAGVAILSALVSLFSHRPCRPDVAMTGEITLTGRVLGIGGVKEKVLGAHRAGITEIILPTENREDLVEIPPEVRKQLKFTFVKRVEQALQVVLGTGRWGRKTRPAARSKAQKKRRQSGPVKHQAGNRKPRANR
ncbi:MAG TPA: endopeptidase La [Phycisphaerae bacterium]|jgi:ATP-dependent Lon protease|nr:endopeptidase La [Phycisphaerae bacterium]HOB75208.1 endopeptidase La [Phycisphaerae bacterium]HOJ54689.1 endopeptidase La [Phycisphaerae bacterium]HOL25961.1 endopeptidase La [Phycisphaerae bacterium]HPP19467.1 endopeptidase La [Phycisphaerae bacterium]